MEQIYGQPEFLYELSIVIKCNQSEYDRFRVTGNLTELTKYSPFFLKETRVVPIPSSIKFDNDYWFGIDTPKLVEPEFSEKAEEEEYEKTMIKFESYERGFNGGT